MRFMAKGAAATVDGVRQGRTAQRRPASLANPLLIPRSSTPRAASDPFAAGGLGVAQI